MFQEVYEPIHGYLAVTVCVLGTLFNVVNILVLTHKVSKFEISSEQWLCSIFVYLLKL